MWLIWQVIPWSTLGFKVSRDNIVPMDSGKSHEEPILPTMSSSFSGQASAGTFLPVSRSLPLTFNNDVADSGSVSEAGDTGDRSLQRRHSTGATLPPLNTASVTKFPLPTEFLLSPDAKKSVETFSNILYSHTKTVSIKTFVCIGQGGRAGVTKVFGIHIMPNSFGCFWDSWGEFPRL